VPIKEVGRELARAANRGLCRGASHDHESADDAAAQ
jgi:hypothetical protein